MDIKYLNKKSKIYMIAPSFGCTTSPYYERLNRAIPRLEKAGHTIIVGDNCFKAVGKCASNTPELRAKEFMDAYRSDCDAIISVGGGEMMTEILDHIDFEEIKSLPHKWFIGFSDNTNLTFTLTTLCDIPTIYGSCAGGFHFKKFTYDVKDTYDMMMGKREFKGYSKYESTPDKSDPFNDYVFDKKKIITAYNYEESFNGTLIGGNLDIMQMLIGTPYDNMVNYCKKHNEGIIFYCEACDLSVLGIKRALIQMKRAGWFNHNIKGILVGRPLCIGQEFLGVDHLNACTDVLGYLNVPILMDVDLGHLSPTMPMKNGIKVEVTFKNNNIYYNYEE